MVSYERTGSGEPLVLLHGTNCSRHIWDPIIDRLSDQRDVIAIDLPAHGNSPATSFTAPGFARDVSERFDQLGLQAPAIVGHSLGGWTALELAKSGRAGAVLALAPAGLWRTHSPFMTGVRLRSTWRLGQLTRPFVAASLGSRAGRRVALGSVSAHPDRVPYDVALQAARDAIASIDFPEHFRRSRGLRFEQGRQIPSTIPIRIIWGENDKIALAHKSRFTTGLPDHTEVQAWTDCGHMIMWDRESDTIAAALQTARHRSGRPYGGTAGLVSKVGRHSRAMLVR